MTVMVTQEEEELEEGLSNKTRKTNISNTMAIMCTEYLPQGPFNSKLYL